MENLKYMKPVLFFAITMLCSCSFSNNENFQYCHDKFSEANSKFYEQLAKGNLDSMNYYDAVANTYFEMEKRFLR